MHGLILNKHIKNKSHKFGHFRQNQKKKNFPNIYQERVCDSDLNTSIKREELSTL